MTKTPAIRNQYGEMKTGMPKGRAIFTPGPGSRVPPSGALPATRRCYVLDGVRACRVRRVRRFPFQDTPGMDGQLSEPSPTLQAWLRTARPSSRPWHLLLLAGLRPD